MSAVFLVTHASNSTSTAVHVIPKAVWIMRFSSTLFFHPSKPNSSTELTGDGIIEEATRCPPHAAFSWLPDKNVIVSLAAFLLDGVGFKSPVKLDGDLNE